MSRFPQIDLVIGAKSIGDFPGIMDNFFRKRSKLKGKAASGIDWFQESESLFGDGTLRSSGNSMVMGDSGEWIFVTIMRGCNYSCSYCIVPSVRGREVYIPPDRILNQIREGLKQGRNKVMLLGQTVNSYWTRESEGEAAGSFVDFSELLRKVNGLDGVTEIKFMSPHPHYMSDRLINTLRECGKVSNEIHLPVQSGSDNVLKAMKRNYSREEYLSTVSKLRRAIPGLNLGTDFIVGFPGETENDFRQTLSLVEEVGFSIAYCFKYSARMGTESSQYQDNIPRSMIEKRLALLLDQVEKSKLERQPAIL